MPPGPLNSSELHLRLIMQSLANQVSMEWNSPDCPPPELGGSTASENGATVEHAAHEENGEKRNYLKLAVPARDFMVLRVPQHELTPAEIEDLQDAEKEIAAVMKSWAEDGGAYVEDPDGKRRWVGVEPEPKD